MCNPEKFANVNSKSRLPPTQIINQYKRHAESNAQPMAQSTNSVMYYLLVGGDHSKTNKTNRSSESVPINVLK